MAPPQRQTKSAAWALMTSAVLPSAIGILLGSRRPRRGCQTRRISAGVAHREGVMATATERIALVGFGEAAGAFLAGWGLGGSGRVRAYDVKTADPAQAPAMARRYAAAGVAGCATAAEALDGAGLALCLVTADRALASRRRRGPASRARHALARRQLLRARDQARRGAGDRGRRRRLRRHGDHGAGASAPARPPGAARRPGRGDGGARACARSAWRRRWPARR